MLVRTPFPPFPTPPPHALPTPSVLHEGNKTSILLSSFKFKVALQTDVWEGQSLNLWGISVFCRVYAHKPDFQPQGSA